LEHAQPFLKEVQQSQEVPIVYQPPCVNLWDLQVSISHHGPSAFSRMFCCFKVPLTSKEFFCWFTFERSL
jgi:hypothetical protein